MCLLGDPSLGEDQLPFDGEDYTHILWIDDDILFNIKDIERLFKVDKDIVSGLYLMASGENYAVVEKWDEEFFARNGYFHFLSKEDLKNKDSVFKVSYVGFGFLLIKKGIFEQLKYPWFDPINIKIKSCEDFCMEDVSFCLKCKDNDIPIYVDPQIKVIHCKTAYLK
jgi:GT2 family glycosyltransferase